MPATLKGPYGQTILEPTANPYTIGRSQDNQLVVQDAKVSSHHAEIRSQGQNYEIVDLASSNGTFVNEQRLAPYTPRPLSNGDQIRFGDTVFLFDAGVMPSQPQIEPTVYGGPNQGSNPSYPPTVAAPPSFNGYEYGAQQGGYTPPPLLRPLRHPMEATITATSNQRQYPTHPPRLLLHPCQNKSAAGADYSLS